MNTVFFVVVANEVYVSDYYKQTLKQVKFQEKDSWEVYDVYDFRALIEYMNYPLHYKQFQDSQIKIVYTDPKVYTLITETKDLFDKSLGVSVGYLPDLLEQKSSLLEEENQDEEADKVDTMKICTELLLKELVPIEGMEVVLCPVTLKMKREAKKMAFLEVENIIEELYFEKQQPVEKNQVLVTYNHFVKKLFNKEDKCTLAIKAKRKGIFYNLNEPKVGATVWANKDDLLGVIVNQPQTLEEIDSRLRKIGFFTCKCNES